MGHPLHIPCYSVASHGKNQCSYKSCNNRTALQATEKETQSKKDRDWKPKKLQQRCSNLLLDEIGLSQYSVHYTHPVLTSMPASITIVIARCQLMILLNHTTRLSGIDRVLFCFTFNVLALGYVQFEAKFMIIMVLKFPKVWYVHEAGVNHLSTAYSLSNICTKNY